MTIDFTSGIAPCSVLDHIDVEDRPQTVTTTLFEGHAPSAGDVACIEIGQLKAVRILLDRPLNDRELVDGAARSPREGTLRARRLARDSSGRPSGS